MKGVKLKLNLETVNCVLLFVILAFVIYCVVKQNEQFHSIGSLWGSSNPVTILGDAQGGPNEARMMETGGQLEDTAKARQERENKNNIFFKLGDGGYNIHGLQKDTMDRIRAKNIRMGFDTSDIRWD
jgi:hypothetical protein